MSEQESNLPSLELQEIPEVLYPDGWYEILENEDNIGYQEWMNDLISHSEEQLKINYPEMIYGTKEVLVAWIRTLEQLVDISIDLEDMEDMTQSEIIKTAIIVMKLSIEKKEWHEEAFSFEVINRITTQPAIIDVRYSL